jgi:hypothetical protein
VKLFTYGDIFSARQEFGTSVLNGKLIVIGGYDGSFLNDLYSTDDGTNWVKLVTKGDIFSARNTFGTEFFNGKL